jgi:hypothetical protein
MNERPLVIAILAKSVGHILPFYLESLLAQSEVSSNTIFYIRTNDNNDNTSEILEDFYKKYKWKHKMVFDNSSVDSKLIDTPNHQWNYHRFKILGKIRKKSCDFAHSEGADYFIADCDNICLPHTIKSLRQTGLDCVAPFLKRLEDNHMYSNYHAAIDENGYFRESKIGNMIWTGEAKGLIEVPVVHCTYYLSHNILKDVVYDDNSGRYEYVIFSDNLRKKGISQYLDNREVYGRLFFSSNDEEFKREKKYLGYENLRNKINIF